MIWFRTSGSICPDGGQIVKSRLEIWLFPQDAQKNFFAFIIHRIEVIIHWRVVCTPY